MSTRPNLVGYRVLGRQGELGHVVEVGDPEEASDSPSVHVRGGLSGALLYHFPAARLVDVSRALRTATIDADVVDFTAALGEDGCIDLHLRA